MLQHGSFIRALLGAKCQREVKLSAAFAACFRASLGFRKAVLALVGNTCGMSHAIPSDTQVLCNTEIPLSNRGRIDIELRLRPATARQQALVVQFENKLDTPLTRQQMTRYRNRDSNHYLIALTKHPPETGLSWLRKQGYYALRWQDVHRALSRVPLRGHDRFVCDSFRLYLEELGMAQREDISVADVQRLHGLFRKITSSERYKSDSKGAGLGTFVIADSCLSILDDVIENILEVKPPLGDWSRTGPLYFKFNQDGKSWHHLGFRFRKGGWSRFVGGAFLFPQEGPAVWETLVKKQGRERYRQHSLALLCDRDGVLDPSRISAAFLRDCRSLGAR